MESVLKLEAYGVDTAALRAIFGPDESTILTWPTRRSAHAACVHERFFRDLVLEYVQLDELWGNVKCSSGENWGWVALGLDQQKDEK